MADQKVTALAEELTPISSDLLYLVDNPAGAPISKKATVANVVEAGMVDIGARVYNDAPISINNSASTALTFNTERWDTDTIHSIIANTGRLTATTAGRYLIVGNIRWEAHVLGGRLLWIQLNAATIIGRVFISGAIAGNQEEQIVTTIYNLAATDYVELYVLQSSGGALNIEASAQVSPEFMMQKIG